MLGTFPTRSIAGERRQPSFVVGFNGLFNRSLSIFHSDHSPGLSGLFFDRFVFGFFMRDRLLHQQSVELQLNRGSAPPERGFSSRSALRVNGLKKPLLNKKRLTIWRNRDAPANFTRHPKVGAPC